MHQATVCSAFLHVRNVVFFEVHRTLNSFYSLLHARVVISDWKHEYNHERRHSSLGYLTPVEYARSCTHTFEEADSHTEWN